MDIQQVKQNICLGNGEKLMEDLITQLREAPLQVVKNDSNGKTYNNADFRNLKLGEYVRLTKLQPTAREVKEMKDYTLYALDFKYQDEEVSALETSKITIRAFDEVVVGTDFYLFYLPVESSKGTIYKRRYIIPVDNL